MKRPLRLEMSSSSSEFALILLEASAQFFWMASPDAGLLCCRVNGALYFDIAATTEMFHTQLWQGEVTMG